MAWYSKMSRRKGNGVSIKQATKSMNEHINKRVKHESTSEISYLLDFLLACFLSFSLNPSFSVYQTNAEACMCLTAFHRKDTSVALQIAT